VGHRLIAGREIDDAQAPLAEADAVADVEAVRVGPSMREHRRHRGEPPAVDRPLRIEIELACDAAHQDAASPGCSAAGTMPRRVSPRRAPRWNADTRRPREWGPRALAWAAGPGRAASAGPIISRPIRSASARASPGAASSPVRPSSMSWRIPPTADATIGR